MMIKVMVVDDHLLIRRGIVLILEKQKNIQVVAEAENGCDAIVQASRKQPDIILMDISMPNGLDGFVTAEQILNDHKEMKIIFLSMHDEESYIQKAIQLNGCGYILKNSQSSELHEAIQTVFNGERYFKVSLPDEQIEKLFKNRVKITSVLSVQERKIIRLTILGFTNRQIAQKLYISHKTVENHKSNIMHKLNLSEKSEMIQFGLNNQYVL